MRSPALRKFMDDGFWTVERVYDRLESGSLSYLKKVICGLTTPTRTYAEAIKYIIVPPNAAREVTIEDLFPALNLVARRTTSNIAIADDFDIARARNPRHHLRSNAN